MVEKLVETDFLAFTDDDPVVNFYDASMTYDPKRKVWVLIGLIGGKNALNWCNKSLEVREIR